MKPHCGDFPEMPPTWQLELGRSRTQVTRKFFSPTNEAPHVKQPFHFYFILNPRLYCMSAIHCWLVPRGVNVKSHLHSHLNSEWFLYSLEEKNSLYRSFLFYYCVVLWGFVVVKCWEWKPGWVYPSNICPALKYFYGYAVLWVCCINPKGQIVL